MSKALLSTNVDIVDVFNYEFATLVAGDICEELWTG